MKGKQILIAFAALVLLSAYFYFFSIKKKQDEQKAKDESSIIFPGVKMDEITELTVKTKETKITVKRAGNDWDMTAPEKAPADKNLANAVARHMESVKAARVIEGALLADFGLNTPQVYTEFVTKDGRRETLFMSGFNTTGEQAYAYKSGNNSVVYLVDKDVRGDCDKTVQDFRYKGLLRQNEDAVTKITVNLKDKKYTVEKQGDDWYVTSPFRKLAKKDRIMTVSNYAINSAAKGFYPLTDAAKYGLKNPSEYIKIYEGKTEHTIYYGKKDEKNSSYFARSSFQPDILEVPEHIYSTGASKLDEVFNKQVAVFQQDAVMGARVDYGDKSIISVRNKPGKMPDWINKETKGVDKKDLENYRAASLISAIFWAEYRQVIEGPDKVKEASEYGLEPGTAKIALVDKDGKTICALMIGGKKGEDEAYVKNLQTNVVYVIPESSVKNMGIPGIEIK